MFYGSPNNLLMPGLARTMGEGWETARRRDDGNDWVLVRLGLPGTVRMVELDTSHFKGNAPGAAMLTGIDAPASTRTTGRPGSACCGAPACSPTPGTGSWCRRRRPDTHVRLDVYPDGGMARLRLFGDPT